MRNRTLTQPQQVGDAHRTFTEKVRSLPNERQPERVRGSELQRDKSTPHFCRNPWRVFIHERRVDQSAQIFGLRLTLYPSAPDLIDR